jgi:hypothetical protein
MKLDEQTYFNLLDDGFIYKTHQEEIDKFIKEEVEKEEKRKEKTLNGAPDELEMDELLTAVHPSGEHFSSPKEIEIPDSEYENLKQHSEWLNKYEWGGDKLFGFAFESYRDRYEKEQRKNDKLQRVIEGLMDDNVYDMRRKVRVLLGILE